MGDNVRALNEAVAAGVAGDSIQGFLEDHNARVARASSEQGDDNAEIAAAAQAIADSDAVFDAGFDGAVQEGRWPIRPPQRDPLPTRAGREGDTQPLPQPSDAPIAHRMVQADLEARLQLGIQRYGQPLQAFNGRNSLRDAYEEVLDLAVYLRTALYEQEHPQEEQEPVTEDDLTTEVISIVSEALGGSIAPDAHFSSLLIQGLVDKTLEALARRGFDVDSAQVVPRSGGLLVNLDAICTADSEPFDLKFFVFKC